MNRKIHSHKELMNFIVKETCEGDNMLVEEITYSGDNMLEMIYACMLNCFSHVQLFDSL